MKRITYLIAAAILFGVGYACTDDFNETNKNPNKLYTITPQLVFPGIVYKTLDNLSELNYQFYSWYGRYVEYPHQTPQDTKDMSGVFGRFYTNILKDMKKLEDDVVGNPGYVNSGNMIMTWKAYLYFMMVSSFGGVPMTEAITETKENTYKYDSEWDIYNSVLTMLKNASEGFDTSKDGLTLDPLFRGADGKKSDIVKWRKFANTLRLYIALSIQNMDPALAEEHVRAALAHEDWLISSVDDIAKMKYGINETQDGSYYYRTFLKNFENGSNVSPGLYPRIDHYFFLYLRSYNDPRLKIYGQRSTDADRFLLKNDTITRVTPGDPTTRDSVLIEYLVPYLPSRETRALPLGWEVGIDPNSPGGTGHYNDPYNGTIKNGTWMYVNRDLVKIDATMVILNWADACFMKAEAALKYPGILSQSAETYYNQGIEASMAEWGVTGSTVTDYKNQNGVKWNTDGNGMMEYREFYKADIKGAGGTENHLEQIYKQWYIADFFNGHAAWTLERRTRTLKYPPYFYNGGVTNEGSNGLCDYVPERLLYAVNEMSYNKEAYYKAVSDLQSVSPTPNSARWGDNFYTTLRIAKPNPLTLTPWVSGTLKYNSQFLQKWYGKTEEEMLVNSKKEYPSITSVSTMSRYIGYKVTTVLSTYIP